MLDFFELIIKFAFALTALNAVLLLTWIVLNEYLYYRNQRIVDEWMVELTRRSESHALDDVYEQNRNIIDPLY